MLSPFALGCITFGALMSYFWLSGLAFPSADSTFWLSPMRATGTALTYSATPAFLLGATRAINRKSRTALAQLADSNTLDPEAVTSIRVDGGYSPTHVQNAAATVIGLFLGSLNVPWVLVLPELGGVHTFESLSVAVGNLVTWTFVAHGAMRRILVSLSFRRAGRWQAKVDLFRLDALLPFGRVGVLDLLTVVIVMSFSAFQSLDAEFRMSNFQWALSAGIPAGLVLLLLPMLGVRQNARLARRRALESIDALIGNAKRELDPESMRYLGDLLARREILQHAREWPLDTTAFSRIAIYFVIPPLAWVGGALVEIYIGSAIASP